MADILTIDQARAALDWKPNQNTDRDDEISTIYIPAVTEAITAELGTLVPGAATLLLVARRVLKRTWNSDHQGAGGTGGRAGVATPPQPKAVLTDDDRAALGIVGGFA